MSYVLAIFGIFLVFTLLLNERDNKEERYWLIFPLFLLMIYTGTRIDVGGYDYHVYKYFYELPDLGNPYRYEKFFVLLRNRARFIGLNYNSFLFVLSVIFNLAIYKLFIDYSFYPSLSFLIYLATFYHWHNFTIIRNFMAILIFWFSLKYILKRKIFQYFFLITVAYFFHQSAIILYPLYFILNRKFSDKELGGIYGLALLINPISFLLFEVKIELWGLSERLTRYAGIVEKGNFYEFAELLVLVLILLFFRKKSSEKENLIINLNLVALFIFIAFYRFAILLRFLEYFRFGMFIAIPFLLSKIEDKKIRQVTLVVLCCYLTWKYYDTAVGYALFNYKTLLFDIYK